MIWAMENYMLMYKGVEIVFLILAFVFVFSFFFFFSFFFSIYGFYWFLDVFSGWAFQETNFKMRAFTKSNKTMGVRPAICPWPTSLRFSHTFPCTQPKHLEGRPYTFKKSLSAFGHFLR